MLPDPKVQEALKPYVRAEWRYDGLKGSVIGWTQRHGIAHEDPAHLGWILDAEEKEYATPKDGFYADPATLARRLTEVARAHPGAGTPFVLVEAEGGLVPEIDEAKGRGEPVLLYFRVSEDPGDKKRAKSAKACREMEEKVLAGKKFEKTSKAFACFKLDLGKAGNREFAGTLGVSAAPAVALIPAGDGEPMILKAPTASGLAEAMTATLKPQNP